MRNSQSGFERWNELLNETVEKLQIAQISRKVLFQLCRGDFFDSQPRVGTGVST